MKLGAIRLTDRFFPDGTVRPRAVRDCREYIRSYLAPLAHEIDEWGFEVAVGSSGTINAIAAIVENRRGRDPSRGVNNVVFTRADLDEAVGAITSARTTQTRRAIPGLDARRADIIVGGALLLEQIFDALRIESMTASEFALREGVLLDIATTEPGDAFHHLSDIRRRSVQRMVELFERDREHVEHSSDLALRLFDQTKALHGLDTHARDLLEAAGALHNVGLFISHSAHHKHSYYVIRNCDQLVGFTDHEIELMALVARYHRKSTPSPRHAEFAALDPEAQQLVRVLAGLLRIAIALDRGHAGAVRDVTCRTTRAGVEIAAQARPGADASLELYAADQRRDLLESALARAVHVTLASTGS